MVGEGVVSGVCGSRSHSIHSHKAGKDECWCSAHFSFLFSWSSRHRMVSSHSGWAFLHQLNISTKQPHRPTDTQTSVSWVILHCHIDRSNHHNRCGGVGAGRRICSPGFNGTKLWKLKTLWSWMVVITAEQCGFVCLFVFSPELCTLKWLR